MKTRRLSSSVGLHRITWRTTTTALSNMEAVADALAWLIGDDEAVTLDRSRSYHGPEVVLIEASTSRNRLALDSLARLGVEALADLRAGHETRYDENNVLHFRLELPALLNGEVRLAGRPGTNQVKGEIKVQVYPGQSAVEQLFESLEKARERATTPGEMVE